MSLHNFLLFHLRCHIKNSCFVFHQGFQTPRNNKSTRPAASCFHYFLGVWNPWWNTRTRFWYITSNTVLRVRCVTSSTEFQNKRRQFQKQLSPSRLEKTTDPQRCLQSWTQPPYISSQSTKIQSTWSQDWFSIVLAFWFNCLVIM